MTLEEFLKAYITDKSNYKLSDEETKTIKREGLNKFIYKKLNSSKYKSVATDKAYDQEVLNKINICIDHEIPLHILLPFGATKNPNLKSYPSIDWGEALNIAFLRDYLKPIAAAYKHGVILEYYSVAIIEESLNNLPIKDSDVYDKEFEKLIKFYQSYLPDNFKLLYSRVGDLLHREIVNKNMEKKIRELRKTWNTQPKEVIAEKLKRAERNCMYSSDDKDFQAKLLKSALAHDAFSSEAWLPYTMIWSYKNIITLGHSYTKGWAMHIKSTPGSTVNFWSGMGAIIKKEKKEGDAFIPTVLSLNQYKSKEASIKETKVNVFPQSLKLKSLGSIFVVSE